MTDDAPQPAPISVLELVKTRLRVVNGELLRENRNGGFTMRLPLTAIESVDYRPSWESYSLLFFPAAIGLALLAALVAENNFLVVFLYVTAGVAGLIALTGLFGKVIVIRSRGNLTRIQCLDDADEGDGFVCSLRQMIEGNETCRSVKAK